MRSLHQSRPQDWARRTLTTIGEAVRLVKAETLEQMVDWIVDKLIVDHWSVPEIKTVLIYSSPHTRQRHFAKVQLLSFSEHSWTLLAGAL